ncbi:MAG: TerC/Alx family metal homeostasis membrane protein [Candidatus Sumerlaeota bacterium]|nr:TerC/Alx family metal homeostasis membrane protein [Candidatus Sumerlaeota bacterium]
MTIWLYAGFVVFVALMMALDLGVLNRKAHVVSVREAIGWTAVWVSLAGLFVVFVDCAYTYHWLGIGLDHAHVLSGPEASLLFTTAYIVEESLSLDNVFVMALAIEYFAVPACDQHRVLFWGIVGAVLLRAMMIAAGAVLVAKFAWMNYVFGAILLATALKMLVTEEQKIEPERNPVVRLVRRFFLVTPHYHGEKFFVRAQGGWAITPLLLVVVLVAVLNMVFAVDSVPAVFTVTNDPFIVLTSNVFAILGLRSIFFALTAMMRLFQFLNVSLVFLLAFMGVKMLIQHFVGISNGVSLGVIVTILAVGIVASIVLTEKKAGHLIEEHTPFQEEEPAPAGKR